MTTTTTFISKRLNDVAVRTPRCNDIIRREPREIPRRLRGLLLAIDGRQPIRTYMDQLDGFGDVEALMAELATLGLIEFKSPRRSRVREGANGSDSRLDSNFGDSIYADSNFASFASDSLLSDSTVMPDVGGRAERSVAERANALLDQAMERRAAPFAVTLPGSFDELVRVARLTNPTYDPTSPQAKVAADTATADLDAQRQVDSLFVLLETVRGERRELKERIGQLKKHREIADKLVHQNRQLLTAVCVLGGMCLLLAGMHLMRL